MLDCFAIAAKLVYKIYDNTNDKNFDPRFNACLSVLQSMRDGQNPNDIMKELGLSGDRLTECANYLESNRKMIC